MSGVNELRLRPWDASRAGGLLFVLAHPDDETFLCGGTIARYAASKIAVYLVCATRGECGLVAGELRGKRTIWDVRTAELACAARVLGLDAVFFLGYRDSGMGGGPEARHPQALTDAAIEECAARIAAVVRRLRPRVVVTHGPYGEYGHPDHVKLHETTLLAMRLASDEAALPVRTEDGSTPWSPEALFAVAINPRGIRLAVRVLRLLRRDPRRFGRAGDVDLVAIAEHAPRATCVVAVGKWMAICDRAFRCHRSQLAEQRPRLLLPRFVRRRLLGKEHYARVLPPQRPGEPVSGDLLWVP